MHKNHSYSLTHETNKLESMPKYPYKIEIKHCQILQYELISIAAID